MAAAVGVEAATRRTQGVARGAGIASAVLSAFWLSQYVLGNVSPHAITPFGLLAYFAVIALGFFAMSGGRTGLVWSWLPLVPLSGGFALDGQGDRASRIASFAAAVVFVVVGIVLDRHQRNVATTVPPG